jgi:chemotaxis protein methyltransferase CheR
MEISRDEFQAVAQLVESNFGIHLTEGKRAMMGSRLVKAVRHAGLRSFAEFYQQFLVRPSPEIVSMLANALSTNHTYFHRESNHFWTLRDEVLPELIQRHASRGRRDLRVWCAAASTGEEPYTLAMVVREALGPRATTWRGGVLATDISEAALETARRGIYPQMDAMELPEAMYRRYFRPAGDELVEVAPALKEEVVFRRFNLMNAHYPFREPFQVVFCRNVMIYFEQQTRREVVDRIYRATAPGGWLFVGHAETVTGLGSDFRPVSPGVYRKDG